MWKLIILSVFVGCVVGQRESRVDITCGSAATNLKRVTLVAPTTINAGCSYTIKPFNNRVCQLRIDFEIFSLEQPTSASGYPQCVTDIFTVGNLRMCGNNAGQHVYIPFNATESYATIQSYISFVITDRVGNPDLIAPDWKLHVTQLECPLGSQLSRSLDLDAPEILREFLPEPRALQSRVTTDDGFWIAPTGCLQYFPESNGTVQSFNYKNGGPYFGNWRYAICFKRTSSVTRLELDFDHFELAFGDDTNTGFGNTCFAETASIGRSEDYLMIPGAVLEATPAVRSTYFCSSSLNQSTATASVSGPFVLQFNSDTVYDPVKPEVGFSFNYRVL